MEIVLLRHLTNGNRTQTAFQLAVQIIIITQFLRIKLDFIIVIFHLVNKKGTCAGELCRMDLEFAAKFAELKYTWNEKYSLRHGFNRQKRCGKSGNGASSGGYGGSNSGNSGANTQAKCCGVGIYSIIYKEERADCCDDGTVRPIGEC